MLIRKSNVRRPTNVSLDAELVKQAKEIGVNISKACESGLVVELARARNEKWLAENGAALSSWNSWIEENGLPLEEFRLF